MESLKTYNPANLITFTESATQHLISQVEGFAGGIGVSLGLMPNGCAGYEYRWDIVTGIEEGYKEHELGPYLFLLDEKSEDFLAGSTVDLVNEGVKGKTLTVKSPNASGECGCGESVTFDV